MLRQQISDQVKEAMRARDSVRLEALRFVWSEIKNKEIDKHAELTDEEISALLQKEVKTRSEAIEDFGRAGRDELVASEEAKLAIIKEFLPAQMGRGELVQLVNQIIGESDNQDFGRVMGQVMARVKGKADGKVVAEVVKEQLTAS